MCKKILKLILSLGVAVGSCLQIKAEESRANLGEVIWVGELDDFSSDAYGRVVEDLVEAYERGCGEKIKPGVKGKVGLKVYTRSGLGLCTPHNMVDGVIGCLCKRGYRREDIFLIDVYDRYLRESRYLPALSERSFLYKGVHRVYSADRDGYMHEDWYYESPLKPLHGEELGEEHDRKSYLAYPLLMEVDFWINMPMVVDDELVGLSGCVVNGTLWNVTNAGRFWMNPGNGSVAVAEIGAIPELRRGLKFTLLTLERYQYIGGIEFNSLYTNSEKGVYLGVNEVMMDYMMYEKVNELRESKGFMGMSEPKYFNYLKVLGVGNYKFNKDNLVYLK